MLKNAVVTIKSNRSFQSDDKILEIDFAKRTPLASPSILLCISIHQQAGAPLPSADAG